MVVEVKPVAGPFVLGEGPHWDEETKSLYFVDINGQFLCKFNPATETVTKCALDRKVGFVLPVEGKKDQFLIGYGEDFAVVTWDGQSEKPQDVSIHVKGDPSPDNRINDGKADPTGRVYAGSMCEAKGANGEYLTGKATFYSVEKGEKFYYIDSLAENVRAFDYNKDTGDIGNEQVAFNVTANLGSPDGMTIDSEGKLWVACFKGGKVNDGQVVFDLKENNIKGIPDGMTIDEQGKLWVSVFGGGKIIRVDPDTKQLLFTLPVPAHQTTSVAWGGDNYDELYITSANFPDYIPEEERDKYSHNGYLFKATGLGVKGLPPTNAKL
ncbi:hypothetical protein M8J75_010670 [Diaphorina citri]|nr:hypothetical protein M8J75_010670 [Diaphorina citri]